MDKLSQSNTQDVAHRATTPEEQQAIEKPESSDCATVSQGAQKFLGSPETCPFGTEGHRNDYRSVRKNNSSKYLCSFCGADLVHIADDCGQRTYNHPLTYKGELLESEYVKLVNTIRNMGFEHQSGDHVSVPESRDSVVAEYETCSACSSPDEPHGKVPDPDEISERLQALRQELREEGEQELSFHQVAGAEGSVGCSGSSTPSVVEGEEPMHVLEGQRLGGEQALKAIRLATGYDYSMPAKKEGWRAALCSLRNFFLPPNKKAEALLCNFSSLFKLCPTDIKVTNRILHTDKFDDRLVTDRNVKLTDQPMAICSLGVDCKKLRVRPWNLVVNMTSAVLGGVAMGVSSQMAPAWNLATMVVAPVLSYTISKMFPVIVNEEVKLELTYVPHMVSSILKETGAKSSAEVEVSTIRQKTRRLATLPVPDIDADLLMEGSENAALAVMQGKNFWRTHVASQSLRYTPPTGRCMPLELE
jgi:hypothetical protein